jgi:hypothetical protein
MEDQENDMEDLEKDMDVRGKEDTTEVIRVTKDFENTLENLQEIMIGTEKNTELLNLCK